jgi:PHD/YefM family antitoxin component YafN of YafNO toxin-antitoxin module
MKTIEMREATQPLADYAMRIDDETVVIMKNGKPFAVLSSAHGMDAESIALANNPKFVSIIKKSRVRHATEGGISLTEVRRQLGLASRQKSNKKSTVKIKT